MLSPTLQSYVDTVRDSVVQRGETPGTDELRALTARLGVIARELADAEEPANSALSRGELALRNGRFDVALSEFAVAYALRPWDPTTTSGLSRALLERAKETRSADDARRARTWAIRTLDTEPTNTVARTTQEQLAELERTLSAPRPPIHVRADALGPPPKLTPTEPPAPSSNAAVGIAIAVFAGILVVGAGIGAYVVVSDRLSDGNEGSGAVESTPHQANASADAGATPVATVDAGAQTATIADAGAAVPTTVPTTGPTGTPLAAGSTLEVPISLVMPPQRGLDAVTLDATSSELRVYEGQDFFVLSSVLVNGSGQELREASALLRLNDANGQTVASSRLELLADHQAALRPGDRHGVSLTLAAPDTVRTARIDVESVDAGPAPRDNQPTLLESEWIAVPTQGMMAGIYERSRQYTPGFGNSNGYQRLDMLVRNSGSAPITWMKLSLTFFDVRGTIVGAVDAIPVASTVPALAPGEARPFRALTQLPSSWRSYTVRVIEVR